MSGASTRHERCLAVSLNAQARVAAQTVPERLVDAKASRGGEKRDNHVQYAENDFTLPL